jgi:hypothetical protein
LIFEQKTEISSFQSSRLLSDERIRKHKETNKGKERNIQKKLDSTEQENQTLKQQLSNIQVRKKKPKKKKKKKKKKKLLFFF